MNYKRHIPIALGIAAASLGAPALAQDKASGARISVEEIIVTARKTEESIQDIPFSLQAVTDTQIAQRDIRGLDDIARSTPGFTFEGFSTSGASGNPVVRGFANTFTTSRVQNTSVFLNGIYLQRQGMLNPGLLDMQRVEVLKGPQSTLFGRNAFSGAVNYITSEPSDNFGGKASVTIGDDERRDYKFSITGPIIEEKLLGKFSYANSEYDGHTKNDHAYANIDVTGFNTRGDLGGWDNEAFSTALRLLATDDLEIGLDWYHTDLANESQPYYVLRGAQYGRWGLNAQRPTDGVPGGAYANVDLNCNSATLPGGGPFVAGTGNTLWCGELPAKDEIRVDPRTVGTLGETDIVSLKANWAINDDWAASYQYGYANHSTYVSGGNEGYDGAWLSSFAPPSVNAGRLNRAIYNGNPNATLLADSHEVRFEWEGNDLVSGSFGAYYSNVQDEDWSSFSYLPQCAPGSAVENCYISVKNADVSVSGLNRFQSFSNPYWLQMNAGKTGWSEYEDDVYSMFATAAFTLNDDLTLRLEGRYTEEQKAVNRLNDTFGLAPGGFEDPLPGDNTFYNPATGQCQNVAPGAPGICRVSGISVPQDSANFYFFAPRASLEWKPTADNLIFLTIGKGEKTGGFNNALDASQQTYDPETNWTYELGSKNTFLDSSVILNASIYIVDWKDIQGAEAPKGSAFESQPVANIGDGENIGIEFDGVWNISENWSVDGGFSANDPKYVDVIYEDGKFDKNFACNGSVCARDGNVDGNQLARTSKRQAFWGLNYQTAILDGWELSGRIDGSYQSKQYADILNLAYVPSRVLYNANITLQAPQNWELTLWGKNIFDKEYAASSFVISQFNQYVVALGAGASYGATLTYNF